MTSTATAAAATGLIQAELPLPFHPGWNRIAGISAEGALLSIDPAAHFYRYEDPTWLLCDWAQVRARLLPAAETTDVAVEQLALDYVKAHGRITGDPIEVLATAHEVYAWLFRPDQLDDPGLVAMGVTTDHLRMLREAATVGSLNRVAGDGHIANVGPCWFFPAACRVVYDLTETEGQALDELYHGTFFNEYRRRESLLAHAALGGRLVHGCQGAPDMTGGAVVPFGTPLETFRAELAAFKREWIDAILAQR